MGNRKKLKLAAIVVPALTLVWAGCSKAAEMQDITPDRADHGPMLPAAAGSFNVPYETDGSNSVQVTVGSTADALGSGVLEADQGSSAGGNSTEPILPNDVQAVKSVGNPVVGPNSSTWDPEPTPDHKQKK